MLGEAQPKDMGADFTACMMQNCVCCAVKRDEAVHTFQALRGPRAGCGDLSRYPLQLVR